MTRTGPRHFIVLEKEPYICENCAVSVMGGRYNNHCPKCLWSKHVDEAVPGDRLATCGGLMKPVGIMKRGDQWRIKHRCVKCGKETWVDSSDQDSRDELTKLSVQLIEI